MTEEPVAGYETTISGYDITNTHTPEKITVFGTKTWDDNDNQDGKRPFTITVNLLANGVKVKTNIVQADKEGNWIYSFTGLDKYANGKEIVYTVTEDAVEGYTGTINGFDITNSYELGSMTVEKVVTGMSEGEVTTTEANFTFTITGEGYEEVIILPANGTTKLVGLKPGKYTVKESDPSKVYTDQNYKYKETSYQAGKEEAVQGLEGEVIVSKNNTTKVIFTNSYEPVGSLEVLKVDSKDGNTVLEGATFTLTGEDSKVQTVKSDKNGVAKFDELQYGEYTLKEINAPAGYLLPEENEWTVTIDNKDKLVEMKIENIKENPSLKHKKKKQVYILISEVVRREDYTY